MNTVASDLRNAALVIEYAGWTQGTEVDCVDGSVCAVGSIGLATRTKLVKIAVSNDSQARPVTTWTQAPVTEVDGEMLRRYSAAERWLDRFIEDGESVTGWNDDPERTDYEVIELMRLAADGWDMAENALVATQADHELAGGPQQS